jgi:two-component system, OmpR family, sensor histidine kinase KdpD
MMRFRSLRPPSRARSIALAVVGPGVAFGLGLAIARSSLVGATSLCLLAVVVAAAFGGLASGLLASVVAFLGLNFFFTEPYHTFTVSRGADLIALFVFLVVSVLVGALLSRAIEERAGAERRVAEARFLDRITARLISGEGLEKALGEFARDLVALFGLRRCEIRPANQAAIVAEAPGGSAAEPEGPRLEVPLGSPAAGVLIAVRGGGTPSFGAAERSFVQALAGQAGLALERAVLDDEVRNARVDVEANRLRAALFSSVTHDLRTPLASIKASASGLLDPTVSYSPGQREEVLRTIVEESDRLNRLVANLMDLARMRAGALAPACEPVWIGDLVNAVLARMRKRLEAFTVRVTIRPDVPAVSADPMQVDQVLTNIIENAARFTPPGGEISVSAARWRDTVQLRIADRGPGIPEPEREQVFEEFFSRDAGAGRGGSGLGLAIARAIVIAHGGRIWVEGTAGPGAVFVVELPVAATPGRRVEEAQIRGDAEAAGS